jgi:MFS family permease
MRTIKKAGPLLLIILFLAFAGVSLPTTLLGSGWPLMYRDLNLPMYFAGVFQMIITAGTIAASLLSGALTKKLGAGPANSAAIAAIALGLLGFALAPNYGPLIISAVILGYGAATLDTGLNNFIALHYKARYINWLHCFYGIGAAGSSLVMSRFITGNGGWRSGYLTFSLLIWLVTALMAASLPLWKQVQVRTDMKPDSQDGSRGVALEGGGKNVLLVPGVKASMMCFFSSGCVMGIIQVWAPTYLVMQRGFDAGKAAGYISIYFFFVTVCRFLAGLINGRISNRIIILSGCACLFLGFVFMLLPMPQCSFIAFMLLGFGIAPVVPALVHENPLRFGTANSQAVVGLQFAASYTGSFAIPILTGFAISNISMALFPFLLLFFIIMLFVAEWHA